MPIDPMPRSEIMAHYRRRDWLSAALGAARLFLVIVWRPFAGGDRIDARTAWSVAWGLSSDEPYTRALRRACKARGFDFIPCDLIFQTRRKANP